MRSNMSPLRCGVVAGVPLGSMRQEMDELFGCLFRPDDAGARAPSDWPAPLALWEEDGKIRLEVELPGVSAESLDLAVEEGRLYVRAERKTPETPREYWHNERRFGKVERYFALPDYADPEAIEADLHDGVLSLAIGKKPEAQPKRIHVKVR